MKERKLKKVVVYGLYSILLLCFCTGLFFIERSLNKDKTKVNYVDKTILEKEVPVVKKDSFFTKPFKDETIEVLSNFYDYKAEETNQQNSIIYFDNTYMQNSGIIYGKVEAFEVLAAYDGEIIKAEETELLGKVVEIRHSNDVISIYQLLSETKVQVGQTVKQGDVIGTSGQSNILNSDKQQLYFELAVRGEFVNAENYYGKKLNEI